MRQVLVWLCLVAVGWQEGEAQSPERRIRLGRRRSFVNPYLIRYEKREMSCSSPREGLGERFPSCTVSDKSGVMPFQCFPTKATDFLGNERVRWNCNLNCPGARRTMEIRKRPHAAHSCVHFYTYNTERRDGDWFFWLDDKCFRSNDVTFTVWCELEPIRPRQ